MTAATTQDDAPLSTKPSCAMVDEPPISVFERTRDTVLECLYVMGAVGDIRMDGIAVIDVSKPPEQWVRIPFFQRPPIDDVDSDIIGAIRRAGGPLQHKEIAGQSDLSLRVVQRRVPILVDRGILRKHPSLGFYLPGQKVEP